MLHPKLHILEAVKNGEGSNEGDKNPYLSLDQSVLKNKQKVAGWESGYKIARDEEALEAQEAALPFCRKILCRLGFHKTIKKSRIPGRPYISRGEIVGRDSPIIKYECVCGYISFKNLGGSVEDQERRRKEFRKRGEKYEESV